MKDNSIRECAPDNLEIFSCYIDMLLRNKNLVCLISEHKVLVAA